VQVNHCCGARALVNVIQILCDHRDAMRGFQLGKGTMPCVRLDRLELALTLVVELQH
jgi:hypothetical protein